MPEIFFESDIPLDAPVDRTELELDEACESAFTMFGEKSEEFRAAKSALVVYRADREARRLAASRGLL